MGWHGCPVDYDDLYSFSPSTVAWAALSPSGPSPSPRDSAGFAATADGNVYVFGGRNGEGGGALRGVGRHVWTNGRATEPAIGLSSEIRPGRRPGRSAADTSISTAAGLGISWHEPAAGLQVSISSGWRGLGLQASRKEHVPAVFISFRNMLLLLRAMILPLSFVR